MRYNVSSFKKSGLPPEFFFFCSEDKKFMIFNLTLNLNSKALSADYCLMHSVFIYIYSSVGQYSSVEGLR